MELRNLIILVLSINGCIQMFVGLLNVVYIFYAKTRREKIDYGSSALSHLSLAIVFFALPYLL